MTYNSKQFGFDIDYDEEILVHSMYDQGLKERDEFNSLVVG